MDVMGTYSQYGGLMGFNGGFMVVFLWDLMVL
jgi:hypothetical protein